MAEKSYHAFEIHHHSFILFKAKTNGTNIVIFILYVVATLGSEESVGTIISTAMELINRV